MTRWFQIDVPAMKLETLTSIAKMTMPPAQQKAFADSALVATTTLRPPTTTISPSSGMARGVRQAEKAGDGELVKQLLSRDKEADTLKLAFNDVKAAQDKLDEHPLDPDANLAVGRYRTFMKTDWDHGIPMLALGAIRSSRN